MAKRWETFEEAHARALKAAHEEMAERLRLGPEYWEWDMIYRAITVYEKAMGYSTKEVYQTDKDLVAIERALQAELKEKGDQFTMSDLLDRCLRADVKALGERWPEDKPAKVAQISRKAA